MPLLAAAFSAVVSAAASAADDGDRSDDALVVVKLAQTDGGTDSEPNADRRLVDRESSERVDAVVIALWSLAAVMTVMLGLFLWHTSPRRRLRLARYRSTQLYSPEGGSAGEPGSESSEEVSVREPGSESSVGLPVREPGSESSEGVSESGIGESESEAEEQVSGAEDEPGERSV